MTYEESQKRAMLNPEALAAQLKRAIERIYDPVLMDAACERYDFEFQDARRQ